MSEAGDAIARLKNQKRKYLEKYFGNAPDELMEAFRKVRVKAGRVFITEGTEVDFVYVLLQGRVTAVDYRVSDTVYGYTDFEPVEVFGVMEILGNMKFYRTTLAAATDCTLLRAAADPFAKWILNDTSAMRLETENIIGYMLIQARKDRLYLLLPASGRISLILKNLYEHYGHGGTYSIYVSRKDLGEMSGLSERTVTRTLKDLESAGCISRDGRKIVIDSGQYLMLRESVSLYMSDGMEE